jgi:(p)ppGpp synthase/HD superfamily hydrolase
MPATFKQLTDFIANIGADQVEHTGKGYLAHAIGVHNDLKSWGCDEEVCRAGIFHSIYGTELFQRFALPVEQRDEVRQLIGQRAEWLAYVNCAMDRDSFDAAVQKAAPPHGFCDRLTGEEIELSEQDFNDLCTIHLCDWLEQVPRSKRWDYRAETYRRLAERLGGIAMKSHRRVFSGDVFSGGVDAE